MANVTVNLAASADDGHEFADDLGFTRTDTIIRCNADTNASNRTSGFMRFVIPMIESGDTIDNATMDVFVINALWDDPTLDMHCEDVDDSADLAATADIINRALTTASAAWVALGAGTGFVTSPSFTAAVQEVIDRVGWSAGNGLGCIWVGRNQALKNLFLRAQDFGSEVSQISIDYTVGAAGQPFRRRGMMIPGWAGGRFGRVA